MAASEENWFSQRNKYTYLHLMMIMTDHDVTSVNVIHDKLKCAGKWVDLRRFVKKHKHFNTLGLFELFGDYSDQSADDVRDCLMGWILDNYRNVVVVKNGSRTQKLKLRCLDGEHEKSPNTRG